jgi:hypothetical protein
MIFEHSFLSKYLIFALAADNPPDEVTRKTTISGYCNSPRERRKASAQKFKRRLSASAVLKQGENRNLAHKLKN